MLKEHTSVLRRLAFAADLSLVAASFFIAYELRSRALDGLVPLESYLILVIPLLLVWGCCLDFFGMYQSQRTASFFQVAYIIFKTNLAASHRVTSRLGKFTNRQSMGLLL